MGIGEAITFPCLDDLPLPTQHTIVLRDNPNVLVFPKCVAKDHFHGILPDCMGTNASPYHPPKMQNLYHDIFN